MNVIKLFVFMCVIMFGPAALAQDARLPIDIISDSLDLERDKGYGVFSGNVQVTHGEILLHSDKLEVFYTTAKNNSTTVREVVALGKVKVEHGADVATAEKAIYNPADATFTMSGDVTVLREGNVLKGQTLVYDVKTRRLHFDADNEQGKDSRVKATFSLKGVGIKK